RRGPRLLVAAEQEWLGLAVAAETGQTLAELALCGEGRQLVVEPSLAADVEEPAPHPPGLVRSLPSPQGDRPRVEPRRGQPRAGSSDRPGASGIGAAAGGSALQTRTVRSRLPE